MARDPEVGEQPIGGRPPRSGGPFHQGHRQVDADAVAGQSKRRVRRGDGRPGREIAWGEARAVLRMHNPLTDYACGARFRVEVVQAAQQRFAQTVVAPGYGVGVQLDDRAAGAARRRMRFDT